MYYAFAYYIYPQQYMCPDNATGLLTPCSVTEICASTRQGVIPDY